MLFTARTDLDQPQNCTATLPSKPLAPVVAYRIERFRAGGYSGSGCVLEADYAFCPIAGAGWMDLRIIGEHLIPAKIPAR